MDEYDLESSGLRLPPQAIEAEQSILGSIMLNNAASDDVRARIGIDDFYRNDHKAIYQSIVDILDAGQAADVITVSDQLLKTGQAEFTGGLSYLGQLAKSTPSAANVKSYAKIVRDKAVLRRVIDAANEAISKAYDSKGESVSDVVNSVMTNFSNLSPEKYANNNKDVKSVLKSALDDLAARVDSGDKIIGTTTGLNDVDMKINGLQSGKLIVIGGRPSQGKTTLAMNFCESTCNQGGVAQIFSLEMEHSSIGAKLLSSQGGVNYGHINQPSTLESDDWPRLTNATTRMSDNWRMMVDDSTDITIDQIRMTCRETKRRYGQLDIIMIDYLQIMKLPKADRHDISVGMVTKALKDLSKEMGVPVVLLSQLNRGVEQRPDKRPVMSDLKDASGIEQDADVIIFVYRDDFYNLDSEQKGIAELDIAKNKSGERGKVRVVFRGELQRFENNSNYFQS
jgi:replicative DNA helicase